MLVGKERKEKGYGTHYISNFSYCFCKKLYVVERKKDEKEKMSYFSIIFFFINDKYSS